MALCPDVASLTVNQFDGRNLPWRSVIRYGKTKIWYWPLLMTLAVARLQILDDVSNLIQTRMRDRLKLTTIGRFPTIRPIERLGTPIDRRWRLLTSVMYAYAYRAPYCGALSFIPPQLVASTFSQLLRTKLTHFIECPWSPRTL